MRFAEHWMGCHVAAIRDVTPGIREITLVPDAPVAPYPPGSHINVGLLIDGQPQTRSYSLVGERHAERLRIAVRLAPDSRGGSRAMWDLKPGARLQISSPSSLFEIDWTRKNYCLIAGGIGITPITGIAAVLRPRDGIDIRLHYAVKSRHDAAYLEELGLLLGDRLTVHAGDESGRLDLAATFAALPADAIAILCGPMRMLEAARRAWNDSGRAPADLRYETFGSSGLLPTAEFRVRLKGGDEIVVPQNRSMLAALNEAGFEVMSDCERGECGVCAIDVVAVDGEIDHRDVFFSDHQKQGNAKICPCVSRALGTVTVDTLYQPDA